MPLLDVKNLTLGYGGRIVVDKLSFTVGEGDFLSIIGENGTGKTTLVKGLLGLIEKSAGEITLGEGMDTCSIGYLSQSSGISKDFPASVKEVVMSGFLNSGKMGLFYSKAQLAEAEALMKKVGIFEIRKEAFSRLSGGQQQRVLLARALCATKKLILLDEPTTGLDVLASTDFYSLIRKLNKEGVAVVMVSHDITGAVKMSSHILYLGKNDSFFGTTHQFLHSDKGKHLMLSGCPCDSCAHNKGGEKNA